MSSARADDMAWRWLLKMPPMRYSDSNAKIAIFLSHSAPETALATRSTIGKEEFVLGDPLRYPPAKPCGLGPPSPAVRRAVRGHLKRGSLRRFSSEFCDKPPLARACPGHPRLTNPTIRAKKTWVAGPSPATGTSLVVQDRRFAPSFVFPDSSAPQSTQKTRRMADGSRTTGYPGAGAPRDC